MNLRITMTKSTDPRDLPLTPRVTLARRGRPALPTAIRRTGDGLRRLVGARRHAAH